MGSSRLDSVAIIPKKYILKELIKLHLWRKLIKASKVAIKYALKVYQVLWLALEGVT